MNRNHSRPFFPVSFAGTLSSAAFLFLTATGSVGFAETIDAEQWNITADKMTRYENPPSVIAEGNVVLTKNRTVPVTPKRDGADGKWGELLGETEKTTEVDTAAEEEPVTEVVTLTTIKADWMVYDVDLGTVKSKGHLLIDVGDDQLAADEGVVDLNRETGTFDNATILRRESDLHLEGAKVEKTGEMTYHIEDGWIITCKLKDGETPPWSFGAADADITDGGYAFLKHATFRIKDVPVLYSPYMILPAKRQRTTGLLFPSTSYSDRDGFGMELPLFIDLSPSSDATLYPYYMAERGIMLGAEFRYVLDENDKGGIMANYLDDALSDPSDPANADYFDDPGITHNVQDRYWVRGKVDQDIGEWTSRVDLDIVSDRDYLPEFNSGFTSHKVTDERFLNIFGRGFEDRTLDQRSNSARIQRSWDGMSLEGQFLGIDDNRMDYYKNNSDAPLWKLPSLDFTGLVPIGDTTFDLSWDADYVNYWREKGYGAHRLDLFPMVSAPVPMSDYLESSISFGVRNTSYWVQDYSNTTPSALNSSTADGSASETATSIAAASSRWDDGDTENRFLMDTLAETGTTMMRDFAVNSESISSWNHVLRPYVQYRYVPDTDDYKKLPQFDDVDNYGDQNIIGYGINNFFNIFRDANNLDSSREVAYLKIFHGYDLRSEESDTPWAPVNTQIQVVPLDNFYVRYDTDLDVYGEGVTEYSVETEYRSKRGDSLSGDYRYNEEYNLDSISARARVNLFYNLAAGYSIERSIGDEKTVEEVAALIYQPSCWSIELNSNYTPDDHKIMVIFSLANIGSPFGLDMPGF